MFIVDGPVTASYAARGYLLPDEFYSEKELAEWFPSSIESGSYNGKLYSIPMLHLQRFVLQRRNL